MGRVRCASSFSIACFAVAQLVCNRAGYAQTPPAGEPEGQVQDSNVAPPPPAPANPPPAAMPAPAPGPFVRLHADTPKARLQVQRRELQWEDVCVTPCNRPVSPVGVYRIGGNTIVPSDGFNMPRPTGQVFIEASYGSKVKRYVGIAMIIAGVVNGLAGLYYYTNANDLSQTAGGNNDPDFYRTVGVVSIIGAVVVTGIGIPLSLSSTSVEVR